MINYLQDKFKLLEKKSNDDDLFSVGEKDKLEAELRNIKRILKELYERREKKIIEMALNRSRTGSNIIDTSALLNEEKQFYEGLIETLDKFRVSVLFNILKGERPKIVAEVKVQPEVKGPEVKEEKEEVKEKLVRAKFIHAVPRFIGKNLEIWGPFQEGEEAELPKDVVEILEEKGRVEILS